MRFLVDECFPAQLVRALEQRGHTAVWATDVCRSERDGNILTFATDDGRIVVTEDRDFGTLAIRDGQAAVGIVIANADQFPGDVVEASAALAALIDSLTTVLAGHVTIIEAGRVRQRRLTNASRDETEE